MKQGKAKWITSACLCMRIAAFALCLLTFLSAAAAEKSSSDKLWDEDGSYIGPVEIPLPSADGTKIYGGGDFCIDVSNAEEGYAMVRCSGSSRPLKVQIIKSGKTYNYDLNNQGKYEVFPLQMGDGLYQIRLMQNVSGKRYLELFSASVSVKLKDEFTTFLYPSQYVNYDDKSKAVRKSYELCREAETDLEKLQEIYTWIIKNVKYDYKKAATVRSGYLPDVDDTLKTKKGICFDYSALMACMLRAQGVPTKLVIGTVSGTASHAWNEVYIEGKGWLTTRIKLPGESWTLLDTTFAAGGSPGKNYSKSRIY
jgi:hypothetical protein